MTGTVILKYIDDTKVIAKINNEDDIFTLQDKMEEIYNWKMFNNMKYNGDKFMNLRIGPNNSDIIENTTLFTPGFMEPIKEVDVAKDLGIMFNAKLDFKTQRNRAITKTSNKVSWIF